MPDRQPTGWATYPGDHRHLAGRAEPMGPNYMGEPMWPVTADYDAETNRTRVGFSLVSPS
jgi:hypothetical protein